MDGGDTRQAARKTVRVIQLSVLRQGHYLMARPGGT
jgi:hypothetical protein